MAAPLFLVATLLAFPDERLRAPAAPQEQCLDIRAFRANGGCRVAIDRAFAWLCLSETAGTGLGKYIARIKTEDGAVVKEHAYDRRHYQAGSDHAELFFSSADTKANPDLKIGIANGKDSTVVIGKGRYCMPAEAAKSIQPPKN